MRGGIPPAKVARGTLLSERGRLNRPQEAMPQIVAAMNGETDAVALQVTVGCLLYETLAQADGCGFCRRAGKAHLQGGLLVKVVGRPLAW